MLKRTFYSLTGLFFCFAAMGQTAGKGFLVLDSGDTLKGELSYKERTLYQGIHIQRTNEGTRFYPADSVRSVHLGENTYMNLHIPEEKAGVEQSVLAERLVDGPMQLFRSSFRYRSCTCEDHPEIRKGLFIRENGEEELYLVRKGRLFDRIRNPDDIAHLFLPFEELSEAVEDREYRFSEMDRVVESFNERYVEHSKGGS